MEISIAQNVAGQYRNCCKFLAFFQIGLHFSCIFCILILAIMDLHFFAFFLHPDFWGSIFQLHLFCIFSPKYLFYCFSERGTARPHKPTLHAAQVTSSRQRLPLDEDMAMVPESCKGSLVTDSSV